MSEEKRIKIVIDIDEERYKQIVDEQWLPNRLTIEKAIANGIPFPIISDDGTLTVNVEDGNKVSRVLVCGDNHFGGLYYPEQEPKIGHWIEHEHNGILHIECSECSSWFLRAHLLRNSYCPNCGCRMVEPQKSEDKNDNSKRSKGMKRKYNWHCYQCGNKQNQKQFNKQNNFLCSKCKYANKAERSDKK